MTKKFNERGSNNQNSPAGTQNTISGDNSKGNKRNKSQNDKSDSHE
ncbi:hypothetical protein [Anoxybacteroides tepidamans]|nr:hypothetical protein [Anoxybacillus tepidamans]